MITRVLAFVAAIALTSASDTARIKVVDGSGVEILSPPTLGIHMKADSHNGVSVDAVQLQLNGYLNISGTIFDGSTLDGVSSAVLSTLEPRLTTIETTINTLSGQMHDLQRNQSTLESTLTQLQAENTLIRQQLDAATALNGTAPDLSALNAWAFASEAQQNIIQTGFIRRQNTSLAGAMDVTPFQLLTSPNLFLAVPSFRPSEVSIIYTRAPGVREWTVFQNLTLPGLFKVSHFTIDGVDYLGLPRWANNRFDLDSAIYRFNVVSQRFEQFQLIATTGATEMLFFSFDGIDFLFIVNNRNAATGYNANSQLMTWTGSQFVLNATIPTTGAFEAAYLNIGNDHLLIIGNYFDGSTSHLSSPIMLWDSTSGQFVLHQNLNTIGCFDIDTFTIVTQPFLAVANYWDSTTNNFELNSVVYLFNNATKLFTPYQSIPTAGGRDLHAFNVSNQWYLVTANNDNGSSQFLNSQLFRFTIGQGFILTQSITTFGQQDWETIIWDGHVMLFGAEHYEENHSTGSWQELTV